MLSLNKDFIERLRIHTFSVAFLCVSHLVDTPGHGDKKTSWPLAELLYLSRIMVFHEIDLLHHTLKLYHP